MRVIIHQITVRKQYSSFAKNVSGDIFGDFMHFIVANAKNPEILRSLVKTGQEQGRSLEEKNIDSLTPLQIAAYQGNMPAIEMLNFYSVDITVLDHDRLSVPHIFVQKL